MAETALNQHGEYVSDRLSEFSQLLHNFAIDDFSEGLQVSKNEGEFAELFEGLRLMVDGIGEAIQQKGDTMAKLKRAERQLRETEQRWQLALESMVATVHEPLLVLDANLRVVSASPAFYRTFQVTPEETEGQLLHKLANCAWDIPALCQRVKAVLLQNSSFNNFRVTRPFSKLGQRTLLLNARRLEWAEGTSPLIVLAIEDITDYTHGKENEQTLLSALVELGTIYAHVPIAMMLVDRERCVRKVNEYAGRFAGRSPEEMIGLRGGEALRCLHHLDDPAGCGFGPACAECRVRAAVLETFKDRKSRKNVEAWLPFPHEGKGEQHCLLISTAYLEFDDAERVLLCAQDISELKRAEMRVKHLNRVLDAIRNVNQLIAKEKDRDRLVQRACRSLTETRGYHNAWIALLDEAGGLVTATGAGLGPEFSALVKRLERGELIPCGQQAMVQEEVVVIQEPCLCTGCPLVSSYADRGEMIVRLEYGGRIYGLLCVSIPAHRATDDEERVLLREVAGDIAFALHDIELEKEHRRAVEVLQESEGKYRTLFEEALNPIMMVDEDGRYLDANEAALEFLGCERDELLDKHVWDFSPQALVERQKREHNPFVSRRTLETEYLVQGTIKTLLLNVVPLEIKGKTVLYGIGQDITARKWAEEALRESEEKFRHLVEHSPDGIFLTGERGIIVEWNPALERIIGIDRSEAVGQFVWDLHYRLLPKEERNEARKARIKDAFERLLDRGEVSCLNNFRETTVQHDGGGIRTAEQLVFPIRTERGFMVGTIFRDITERKRADDERARLVAQIRGQAQRMEQILATVPAGVLLLDSEGRVLQANPVAEKELATLAEVGMGEVLTRLGNRPLAELLTSPPTRGLWHEVQMDGCTFEVIARPMQSEPEPEHWVLVVNDVTQEREIRAQLQQQERLAAVGEMAAGIAHDFNNIMAVIVLYTQMGLRMPELPERLRERLQTISQQAGRATELIQQILDFSRRAVLERQPLDLVPFMKEVVELLERTIPENIEIGLSHGSDEYAVHADPTRLQQIVMNLAVNARDAMMPGGGTLRIGLERVRIERGKSPLLPEMETGEWVEVRVTDTGTGIPPEVMPHIFEPFFTTKGPGEGSGLGLAQVYGIVSQHGGRIGVDTKVGEGTTFSIYLPALEARPGALLAPKDSALPQGQGELVLVVEDGEPVRAALVESLEQLNYQTLEAANGEEALKVIEEWKERIALVLSDVVMPEMGGMALFRTLKQRGWEIPVILVTGHSMGKELEELRKKGLAAWLAKPPGLDRLAQAIDGALRK